MSGLLAAEVLADGGDEGQGNLYTNNIHGDAALDKIEARSSNPADSVNRAPDWPEYAGADTTTATTSSSRPGGLSATPTPVPTDSNEARGAKVPPSSGAHKTIPELEAIVCAYDWPQGCGYWLAVAQCESSFNIRAVGYGGAYLGLFQIWTGHGYENLFDAAANTQAAWELSGEGRYTGAWPYCQYQ